MIRVGFARVLGAALSSTSPTVQPAQTAPPPPAVTPAQPRPIPAELAELDTRIAEIADLQADFEQRKHTPLLKQPLTSRGTVLVRADRVRWDTLSPRRSSMVTRTGEIRIYYPDERVVEVYPLHGDLRELVGSPLPRLPSLGGRFDIRIIDPASVGGAAGPGHVAAELLPRTADLKEVVASVRVLLDPSVPCVVRAVMTDPDGERTEIEFKNVRVNKNVQESALELRVPDGTREVHPLGAAPPEPTR